MFNKKCCLPLRQKNLCIIKPIMAFLNKGVVNTWVYILNNYTLLHLYFKCTFAVFSRHPKPEFNLSYPLAVIVSLLTDYQSKDVFREALEFTHWCGQPLTGTIPDHCVAHTNSQVCSSTASAAVTEPGAANQIGSVELYTIILLISYAFMESCTHLIIRNIL